MIDLEVEDLHTSECLISNNLLKLDDELRIQESKILWKWNNKKIPKSLLNIIIEKNDRLRGRRFEISRLGKPNCINARLTKLANSQISNISANRSIKALSLSLKIKYLMVITSHAEQETVSFV